MKPVAALAGLTLCALSVPALAAQSSALVRYDLEAAPAWRVELPADLAEVSGLAFTPDGRLLAHGDERAVVWRFDLASRRPAGRFGLSDQAGVLRGDFEDIAVVGERLFLVTGTGQIYEGRIAPDGQTTSAARRTAGLGRGCEVEGMTWDGATNSLLLLCKTTRTRQWKDQVVILAVSVQTWRLEKEPRILVSEKGLERVTGGKGFSGSGLARHPRTGTFLLIAGPQQAFAEVSLAGEVLGGGRLDKDRHPQPEGIAVAADLTLLISDEAAGKGAAAITAYASRR
ncbi:MAG: hypothetical protein H0T68_03635 [Gemmatimonadales bacterium]|nr:hypothetical protein [Gemmatimonadales bacterium]